MAAEGLDRLLLPAQMQAPKWRNDDSATVTLVTSKELSNEQFLHLSQFKKVNGWLAFQANRFDPGELPKENALVEGARYSPSQRLRFALLSLHLSRGGTKDTFQDFYEKEVDQIIDLVTKTTGH